jgi:biopolymer transport protein TolR
MGAQARGTGTAGGARRRRRSYRGLNSEINVTPFVDVMLVLLIVFMIAAPLLTVGVPVDLPETQAKPMEGDTEPLTVTVKPDGAIFLQDTEVELATLVPKLQAIAENGYEERIFVRGDRNVDYGRVMKVMGALNAAGFKRIGMVTETEAEAGAGAGTQ